MASYYLFDEAQTQNLSCKAHHNLVHGILVAYPPLFSHDFSQIILSASPEQALCLPPHTFSHASLPRKVSLSSQNPAICGAGFWSTCLLSELFLYFTHSPGPWVTTHIFTLLMWLLHYLILQLFLHVLWQYVSSPYISYLLLHNNSTTNSQLNTPRI